MKKYAKIIYIVAITIVLSNLITVSTKADSFSVIPVTPPVVTYIYDETIYYPDNTLNAETFNVKSEINYNNIPNSLYRRDVLKAIEEGKYKEEFKDSFYKDSLRYLTLLNKENLYDIDGNLLTRYDSDLKVPNILVEDSAKVFSVDQLIQLYSKYTNVSIYTFDNPDDYQKLKSNMENIEERQDYIGSVYAATILYCKSSKRINIFYNKELKYNEPCEEGDIISQIDSHKNNLNSDDNFPKLNNNIHLKEWFILIALAILGTIVVDFTLSSYFKYKHKDSAKKKG